MGDMTIGLYKQVHVLTPTEMGNVFGPTLLNRNIEIPVRSH